MSDKYSNRIIGDILSHVVGGEEERKTSKFLDIMFLCFNKISRVYRILAQPTRTNRVERVGIAIISHQLADALRCDERAACKLHKALHQLLVDKGIIDENKIINIVLKWVGKKDPFALFLAVYLENWIISEENKKKLTIHNIYEIISIIRTTKLGVMWNLEEDELKDVKDMMVSCLHLVLSRDEKNINIKELQSAEAQSCPNHSVFFKVTINLVKNLLTEGPRMIANGKQFYGENTIASLMQIFKLDPVSENFIRETYLAIAFVYMLINKDSESKLYLKMFMYMKELVPIKARVEYPYSDEWEKMLKWKFPDLQLGCVCDQCDGVQIGEALKKCPCSNGFYCSVRCQKNHRKIHKRICFSKEV